MKTKQVVTASILALSFTTVFALEIKIDKPEQENLKLIDLQETEKGSGGLLIANTIEIQVGIDKEKENVKDSTSIQAVAPPSKM